jgi:putative ABC transport system substrate-binding protein
MRRREFVVRVGAAALAWPLAARAQRPGILTIGYLSGGSPGASEDSTAGFRRGLKEGGYIDGQDVAIEYRWAEGRLDRLPALAADLVNRKVALLLASSTASAVAAKAATSSIPVVFVGGGDPVKLGIVPSLGRPGGNVTGVTTVGGSLDAKRLEILRDLIPNATRFLYLVNPKFPRVESMVKEIEAAAAASALRVQVLSAGSEKEIDSVLGSLKQHRAHALIVSSDVLFISRREQIVALAERNRIPACYPFRLFTVDGGLMSYGADLADALRRAGLYAARILKGAKPGELPVLQAAKFELVMNRKAAKKLGLAVPRDFLARVDEVIE